MEGQRSKQNKAIVLTPAPQSSATRRSMDGCAIQSSSSATAKRNCIASTTVPGVEQKVAVKRHPRGRNMFIKDGDRNSTDKYVCG